MVSIKREMDRALASIGSLKRALGIPNVPNKHDYIDAGYGHVFTPDPQSAELLAQIFHGINSGRTGYTVEHPEKAFIVNEVKVKQLAQNLHYVSLEVIDGISLARGIQAFIRKHIASEKGRSR
jgi:hypothetical protein